MKSNYLLLFCMLMSVSAFAQQLPKVIQNEQRIAPMIIQPSPDYHLEAEANPNSAALNFRQPETQIGITRFELQTIGSLGRRVGTFEDGRLSGAWLFGLDEAGGWPDRGAGYNHFDGNTWGAIPDESLEVTRSGYPSFTTTPSGVEVVLSHKSETGDLWILQAHTKTPDETAWNETAIPSTVPGGPVWSKIATSGSDGNSVHCVAVSVDPMFGGSVYLGMDQHPLYYRSLDAGQTWDQVDVVIPGLDSSFYNDVYGEGYNIDANGDVVAIGVFDSWGDVAIAKSLDNGTTWEKTIVHDFPLDKYDGSGYTADDIPDDPNAPDSLTILSNDYSGSVLVDNNGKVHVFFGLMYVFAELADQFLDLSTSGIAYWNEDFGPDSIQVIADLEDFDGDGVVTPLGDLAELRYTNSGLTSHPSAGIDADGNMYLVYTAIREDISIEEESYRHVFIIKSEDGGATWSDPFDVINTETTELPEFVEAAYPSIPSRIGEAIHLIYQQDFDPGLTTIGEADDQYIMHIPLDKNTFSIFSDVEEEALAKNSIQLSPNPTNGPMQIQYTLDQPSNVRFSVYNKLGELLISKTASNLGVGEQQASFDLQGLANGIYFLELDVDGVTSSKRIVVQR